MLDYLTKLDRPRVINYFCVMFKQGDEWNGSCKCVQEIMDEVASIDLVVNLKLREDVLISKCLGRRICSECGGNFNVASIDVDGYDSVPRILMPPLLPPPKCASKMTIRADDTEDVVRARLRIYYEEVFLTFFCAPNFSCTIHY